MKSTRNKSSTAGGWTTSSPAWGGFVADNTSKIGVVKANSRKMDNNKGASKSNEQRATPFSQTFFHGTKADLKIGDFIEVGFNSNYGKRKGAKYIFLTATLDAAVWGAELALGEGRERIYLVEPTGAIEDDPDLTDRKFPGNPTKSYRSQYPFRVIGEIATWQGHLPEQVKAMQDGLAILKAKGVDSLNDATEH